MLTKSLLSLLILFTFLYSINIDEIQNISLREKIAQMIMIRVDANYHNKNSWTKKRILKNIKNNKIGGVISFTGNIHGAYYNIKEFQKLCDEHNIVLIEDAACAIGSSIEGQRIGSHSDLVCFSFHPRKVITTGDGGMVTTSNPKYSERLKLLRQHAMSINDRVRHESNQVIFEEYLEFWIFGFDFVIFWNQYHFWSKFVSV